LDREGEGVRALKKGWTERGRGKRERGEGED